VCQNSDGGKATLILQFMYSTHVPTPGSLAGQTMSIRVPQARWQRVRARPNRRARMLRCWARAASRSKRRCRLHMRQHGIHRLLESWIVRSRVGRLPHDVRILVDALGMIAIVQGAVVRTRHGRVHRLRACTHITRDQHTPHDRARMIVPDGSTRRTWLGARAPIRAAAVATTACSRPTTGRRPPLLSPSRQRPPACWQCSAQPRLRERSGLAIVQFSVAGGCLQHGAAPASASTLHPDLRSVRTGVALNGNSGRTQRCCQQEKQVLWPPRRHARRPGARERSHALARPFAGCSLTEHPGVL
jgi:hypothetical protein